MCMLLQLLPHCLLQAYSPWLATGHFLSVPTAQRSDGWCASSAHRQTPANDSNWSSACGLQPTEACLVLIVLQWLPVVVARRLLHAPDPMMTAFRAATGTPSNRATSVNRPWDPTFSLRRLEFWVRTQPRFFSYFARLCRKSFRILQRFGYPKTIQLYPVCFLMTVIMTF